MRHILHLDPCRIIVSFNWSLHQRLILHNNPVRRGLVDHPTDWPWSSARFYAGEKDVPLVMDPLAAFVGLG